MASEGPNSPGTIITEDGSRTTNWVDPDNASSSDNYYAYRRLSGLGDRLKATNFGFSVPDNAIIDGVKVEVELRSNYDDPGSKGYVYDYLVNLVKGGSVNGTSMARDKSIHWPTSDTYITYGGENELWGLTLVPSDINDPNFGFALEVYNSAVDSSPTAYVDHIRMTVYYTISGNPGAFFALF